MQFEIGDRVRFVAAFNVERKYCGQIGVVIETFYIPADPRQRVSVRFDAGTVPGEAAANLELVERGA